jgi:acetyltransferase-like isoleucine patch superfamily enzyme
MSAKGIVRYIINHIRGGVSGIKWCLSTSFFPCFPSQTIRNWGMRRMGAHISKNVKFYSGFSVRNPEGLIIEEGVSIGPKVLLDARCGLTIHKNAVIAYDSIIWTLNHDYNDVHFCGRGKSVDIGEYAWICCRSVILPGIKIGEGAIVASGSVVTKDVEPWSIVGGIPAKTIGKRERKKYDYGYNRKADYQHFI